MKKQKLIVTVIIAIITSVIGAVVGGQLVKSDKPPTMDAALLSFSNKFNENLPMMIDKYTRLDATGVSPGKRLTYLYTVIGISASDVDSKVLEEEIRPGLVNNYKTSKDMKFFRDNKVTLHYKYRDEAGSVMCEFDIHPDTF